MTVESLGHSVTIDKYKNNLRPIYVIAKKYIPVISFNAILQMDTDDISSLGLCCKVREIAKHKEVRTQHFS